MAARRARSAPSSATAIIRELRALGNPANVAGMARYGIDTSKALGIKIPVLRAMAKRIGRDHDLAQELWATGIHEARLLAAFIEEPARVTVAQMNAWARDFTSWDLCDQVCTNVFDRTPHAFGRAVTWSKSPREFVRRAGFALMAAVAWHDRQATDTDLARFLPIIRDASDDDRNYVKKGVSWALRQIGKRSPGLRKRAIATAREIQKRDTKAARWIASDALRELEG